MDLARRQPPTVRLRRLASELRRLRAAAGHTRDDVAERTAINAATLYRIETAKVRPQRRTLTALLDLYEVTDPGERADLIALSRHAAQLGWLQAYESELPELYTTYISFEAEARSVRNFESLFIPGLLQTKDYARAVIKGALPAATEDSLETFYQARIQRQGVLSKQDSLQLWAILDEAALHRVVGSRTTMTAQLQALVEAAALPNVTLQVIPFTAGAHPGMPGSFVVMDFPDPADPALIYIDSMAGDLFLEREPEVRRYTTTFEHLQAAALDPTRSVQLIEARTKAINQKAGTR